MQKVEMTWKEFHTRCRNIAQLGKEGGYTGIIAVSRGGLTAAHIVAKEMRLPIDVYFPGLDNDTKIFGPNFSSLPSATSPKKFMVIEDLVAQGRTFTQLERDMLTHLLEEDKWTFFPVLIDANAPEWIKNHPNVTYRFAEESDWIVFPYEEYDKMNAGDRGLFRDGTDNYGEQR